MKRLAIATIRFYQRAVSPLLPPACRFYPSCSEYAAQAYERFGFVKGSWLTARRVVRCHPFHPGGHDPVPPCSGAEATPEALVDETLDPRKG